MSSLRLRFTLVAGISIIIAVGLTGLALSRLFNNYIETQLKAELEYQLEQITNNLRVVNVTRATVDQPTDPRFETPLSGRYWQISVAGNEPTLSASIWIQRFPFLQSSSAPGQIIHQVLTPSDGDPISVAQWRIIQQHQGKDVEVDIAVATDRKQVLIAMTTFRSQIAVWLSILALALLAAAIAQIFLGLRPMEALRRKVEQIKSGNAARLTGSYPSEVVPLVDEVNELLDIQDDTLRQARTRAGDLAHGLKTPITILSAIARQVHKSGLTKAGADISEQIATMDSHVQLELSRARLAAQYVVNCDLVPSVQRVARTIRKIPTSHQIDWHLDMPDKLEVPIEQQDLSEVLGNVLDNARKWARSQVIVRASLEAHEVVLRVEDDGEGVKPAEFNMLTQRGRRLSDTPGGSGLGLSIAKNIMTAYRGDISFYSAAPGGLGVQLTWPHRHST
ncbi:MAG: HAMP domain-containing histidine kinase [Rhizobiales bacterium]|nr:HAMP domain-containing histidine kinase [Hyphomicrobiales bacterium]